MPTDLEQQRTFLRQLALRINWDGESEPAVWVPFGDFFGDSAGAVPHLQLPSGLKEDGTWYAYWYMPFAKNAKIMLDNDSDRSVALQWEIVHAPLDRPARSLLRFHAKWHRDAFLPTRPDRLPDWTLLTTEGQGRFVGTQLHVWSPKLGWWGEGDEKFFVDGEKFPSTFGTGSEDYFGYAWSSGNTFVQALHGQPVNENNQGHVSVNRWHIADDVPFQTSFEGDIEKYYENSRPTLYADTAFWYLSTDGKDPYQPVPVSDRIGYWVRPPVFVVPGVIEAETMKILKQPPSEGIQSQEMSIFGIDIWSNEHQLYMQAPRVGGRLELALVVKKAGRYQIMARFTRADDYGRFQMELDGQKLGDPVDLHIRGVEAAPPLSLGTVDLAAGQHVLAVIVLDHNPAAHGTNFGLDYIKLVPAP